MSDRPTVSHSIDEAVDSSCHELEEQMIGTQHEVSRVDAETQCLIDQHDRTTQTIDENESQEDNPWKVENEKAKVQIDLLRDEINGLNFQLSSMIIQQATNDTVSNEGEVKHFLIDHRSC